MKDLFKGIGMLVAIGGMGIPFWIASVFQFHCLLQGSEYRVDRRAVDSQWGD